MSMTEHGSDPGARTGLEVAVVGLAGRFPGAGDVDAFWRNLRGGVESISFFTREELLAAGAAAALVNHPDFVPAGGVLRGADELDASLFHLTPRDAEILNPQHRVLLECAWEALEQAGYDPDRVKRPVGVFAGASTNDYVSNLFSTPQLVSAVGAMRITLGNGRDHLAAGISYRLNLRGPSIAVQTACSTSLVAVHLACQSLLGGECDMALAGGVCVLLPLFPGYVYTPDGILSPDGHCRAFDADARGTVGGSGAGVVLLKRLEDALADGDTIRAVIRGSAVNNDGAEKVGYTAPSVTGQARVLSEALSVAGVDAASVQYMETHGSGTPLGDAIELKAMSQVLSKGGAGHRCAIGSVKPNIGHLDAAAGVAGLIKTVLALEHGEIPPSLNCAVPHPEIEASGGRVFVNTTLTPWARNGTPRRAGVSSFGIGGTNAHVVLEEAPPADPSGPSREFQLLVLSARTPTALARSAENLADFLERESPPLADAAFTLQVGRGEMEHRLSVVCRDAADGAARLRATAARGASPVPRTDRPVAFLFPGVGTHHVNMGRGLYDAEPVFRAAVDECCELLRPVLGSDLREVLFSAASPGSSGAGADEWEPSKETGGWDLRRLLGRGGGEGAPSDSPLDETRFAQPAVFVTEYALARLWTSWGVRPRAVIGHSLGEYVAACVAGVLRLEDALRLVALRARLIDALPGGAMLAVPLGEAPLREILPPSLDVAAVNTAESCVVAGPIPEIEAFEAALAARGTVSRRLPARHAFHSRAMAAVSAEVERLVSGFELRAPEVPLVSGVTGTWISDEEARSPAYWARHLCRTVRFADGAATLRAEPGWAFLEVGPGQALGAWARHHPAGDAPGDEAVFSSLRHQHNRVPDLRFILETLGGLWAAGVEVDWTAFSRDERRGRIPLPGYPFERKRHWVDPPRKSAAREGAKDQEAATVEAGTGRGEESHEKGPGEMENRLAAPEHAAVPSRREEAVLGLLKRIVADLTGIREEHVAADTDFFRAGLDSLLLLQAIQVIEKKVGVRVSLVELLEEIATLGALAAHLDRVLPPDALPGNDGPPSASAAASAPAALETAAPASVPESPRVVPAPPAFYPAPVPAASGLPAGGESAMERVIAQQLQLMSQQIAALRGEAAPVLSAAPASAEPAPVPAAAAADSIAADASTEAAGAAPTPRAVPRSPRAKIQPATFVPYQPVNSEGRRGMTPEQSAYLDSFIARYVERTRASKEHQKRYHLPLADGRVTARFRRAWKEILYPIVGQRAHGSRIWDLDGNEYVDTGMAYGCSLFGHAPEFVSRAIQEQVERGYGVGPQSPHAGRAAELVCELGGNERAVFCNSGTEAVMGAIRAARAYTGRSKIAYFEGSYHGWSDVVLGRAFTAGDQREVRPLAPGVSALPLGDVLMLEYDEPKSLDILARHLHEIALVMVEPVQSRRPDMQPVAFLRELRRMTREAGVLLHFDELITGFRLSAGGAQAFFGVDADLVTYGKIVAGGLPMGVVAGTQEAMSVFDGGLWSYGDDSYPTGQRTLFAGAFFKHPLSMAVACAILEEIRRQGAPMYERLDARTTGLVERMNAFFDAGGFPIVAVNGGSCFRFFFGREVTFPDLFNHHLIAEGVHVIPETGTHFLSVAHTDEDLEKIFQAVRASAQAMRGGGLIPAPSGGTGSGPGSAAARGEAVPAPDAASAFPVEAREGGVRVLPLTEGQRQLWFESQMGDDAARAYVESTSVRLRGTLDEGALREALRAVVARHDTLRMTFTSDGDAQVIQPPAAVEVARADFRGSAPEEREAAVEAWLRGVARRPFDLVAGPLVRFDLAALDADEHLLVITTHHAALDGWSFGVIWQELAVLYAAARDGRRAELPPPPDHGAAVRAQVAAVRDDAGAEAFWLAEFADGVPVLELPTDRPRPPVRGYRGERVEMEMGGGLLERLAWAGRRHGLTMFNTLLSAYFAWLSRLSGQDDLVVGTPAAGQAGRSGTAELVGYGINILPIRARVEPSAPFAAHARQVRRAVLRALEHQGFSFRRLVETLLRTRDPSRPPVFAAMMNLDRAAGAASLGDLRAEFESNFAGGSKVDIHFELIETDDALRLRCVYDTDLFERETIDRWLAAFHRLLEQVAADPEVPLARIDLVEPGERRRMVEEWNRTARPYPRGACIHDLFAARMREAPEAPALAWGGESLTYAELDARANRLAHHLVRRGVGPESRVGVLLERGIDLIVSLLAVLKAGGCYVPLDPSYPPGRLALMLDDAGVRVLLTRGDAQPEGMDFGGETIRLDDAAHLLAAEPADAPRSGASPESLAYIVYTSGSTGRPKGVMVAHRHVAQLVAETDYVRLGPGDRVAQASNASFDALTFEAWGALLNGATLVGVDREVLLSPPALREFLRGRGITTLYQTTALLNQLSREEPGVFSGVREVLFGGQASDAESVRRILRAGGPRRLLHMYGPTETTAWCSWEEVEHVDDDALTVSVGRPTGNQRIYVLDSALQPAPVGVPGEAYVGGDGVVRGYLDRPALTAERFLPDPFAAEPGARMYRTGDRLRWRADGRLEFVGRLDAQVKIRGFRIEPGEIESVLSAHPGVREARVIVREDEPGEKRLVAYTVGAAAADELREHLRRSLPEYMVPAAFVRVESLPLTPSGKLDAGALPAPEAAGEEDRQAAPRRPAEEVLAGIWAEVLRRDRVGARENFFELGGHSLLAMRVVSRVRSVFGVELPVRALFEGPTVTALARVVETLRGHGRPPLPPLVPVARGAALPLSFAQERLWFLDRLQPGGVFYNITLPLRLEGALDAGALERALGEIVRRHEALRTTFGVVDDAPVQVIAPFAGFALPVEDLSGLGAGEREAEAARRAGAEAARPFDLSAGPLFRARLLRLGDEDHHLLLAMHHAVSDGWSLGVFFGELAALYEAFREGRPSPLPALAVQYADYAAWQRATLDGPALEGELAWWKERLSGAPELLELPADHPRPAVMSFRGATEPVHLPHDLSERLRALGRREGATPYMVLLGAFQVLLGRYAASDDVVVGTTIAGRTRGEAEPLIGLFMNTLALRTDLSGEPSFREVLRRVRDVTLGAFEHQEVPFEKLVDELRPGRSLSHSPVFQVLFELHTAGGGGIGLPGLRTRGVDVESRTAKYDLSVALTSTPRGMLGGLTYATDLFERGTARRMVEHLERVLEQAAADPDRRISRLELMGRAERARVVEWNRTSARYPADRCIHQLFEAQAAATPGAVAVTFAGRPLTYRELDGRANQLARWLAARGVGPEVKVALCLERSLEIMVAILGVLKAGGAYVPVDPAHPAERLAYMLEDSGAAVLLTQERLRDGLPPAEGVRVVAVDAEWEAIAGGSEEPLETAVTSENLAYVIYTSGSTGRPKGVAMHHRGVCNYLHWGIRFYGADRGAGAPVFSSMAVDLTITNLLPLFAGLPVHLLPEENPVEALAEVLRGRPGFGLIKITPLHLGLLTPLLSAEEAAAAAHTLVIGADFLSAEPTVFWQEHAPGVRLMNEYGPTETVVGCSAYVLSPGRHRAGPVPVGRPIQNLAFYVLDAHLEAVPVGLPGELYIGGAGVARGYLGRPGLTAEKFVPDPFDGGGARMYRTGDRARWLADGNLVILGRTDHQVKIRGYRVEPGEVEAVLRRAAGVRECLVVAREDRPGDRRLVAYVVGGADPEALRRDLRAILPEYMVPSAFVVLESLPQTRTGKLDPRSLPAPAYGPVNPELEEPATYVEARLIQIWEEVLGVEGIGPTQSFFDLGGNSFLALRLFTQANRRLGCDLPVATLFAGATVRHMAEAILEQKRAAPEAPASVVPLQPHGSLPPVFFIHSADRNVMGYVNLVRHLGPNQPAFGVRDLGEMSRPVERIAADHVAAIRAVRPHGPYHLLSWSFGGIVAFEMAAQLEREGEEVGFVGMLDTVAPDLMREWGWERDADVVIALANDVAARMRTPFTVRPEELEGLELEEQVRHVVAFLRERGPVPDEAEAALLDGCRTVRDRIRSYSGYDPGRFGGTLTLFRAEIPSEAFETFFASRSDEEKHALGWTAHCARQVEVHLVPGHHSTIASEPHVRVLAEHMREALAAARERAAHSPTLAGTHA